MKRKLVVCMTAFAMTACILSASAVYADDAEESDVSGIVNEFALESGNQAFVYVPQGEGIDVGHNATWKPIILVYNDTVLDADSVEQLAVDGGFADIAAQEQCEPGRWRCLVRR